LDHRATTESEKEDFMAKTKTLFVCQVCGQQAAKWAGKCSGCESWNTLIEEEVFGQKGKVLPSSLDKNHDAIAIRDVPEEFWSREIVGIAEFDRVVGGGLVQGSVLLVGGEPGIGKSTLLMEVCGRLAKNQRKILYVSGEESVSQIANRSKRIGVEEDNILLLHESNWQLVEKQIKKIKPDIVIIDSIQTLVSMEIPSAPGTVSQIREVTYELVNLAKGNNITCFIIGHVTKEGTIAGPKILEHMVDVVIYFEGDNLGQFRMLRVIKNRFGNANEVGIFEMTERGLAEIKNPSQLFIDSGIENSFGRSISCIVEGSRALFVEIQSLVVENKYGNGRRTTQGVETNRLAMLVAVIEKYLGIPLAFNDIYLNVVGGVKLTSRESDLSIIASILSSLRSETIPSNYVFLGEVGLTGEVRTVPMMEMRLKEMSQLNYQKVILSNSQREKFHQKFPMELVGIKSIRDIEDILF
jgi:DNA repair protein RadA/Sms